MVEDRLEVLRKMLEAFNRDDLDEVIASFDEHCQIVEPFEMPDRPVPGFQGHEGVRDWMTNLRESARAEFELHAVTQVDDRLLCELTSRGLGQSSGAHVEWTTFAIVRIRDAKIEQIRVFLDRKEAWQAAGLPSPGLGSSGNATT